MLGKRSDPLGHRRPAHLQKQVSRIKINRTDGPAQPAKTAFKGQGQGGVILGIDPVGDFFRISVSYQKSALPPAKGAFDALFSNIFRQIDQVASHFLSGR